MGPGRALAVFRALPSCNRDDGNAAHTLADLEAAGRTSFVYRFIGASAASSDQRALLISLIEDLATLGVVLMPEQLEDDLNKLAEQVRVLISAVTNPVVIFIDALDQLRKPWRLGWLPSALPDGVKIVLSALEDEAFPVDSGAHRMLREHLPAEAFIAIEPLTTGHGYDILRAHEKLSQDWSRVRYSPCP